MKNKKSGKVSIIIAAILLLAAACFFGVMSGHIKWVTVVRHAQPFPESAAGETWTVYESYYNAMYALRKHLDINFAPENYNSGWGGIDWYIDGDISNGGRDTLRFERVEYDNNGNIFALIIFSDGSKGGHPKDYQTFYAVYFSDWSIVELEYNKPIPDREPMPLNENLPKLYTWLDAAKTLSEHFDGRLIVPELKLRPEFDCSLDDEADKMHLNTYFASANHDKDDRIYFTFGFTNENDNYVSYDVFLDNLEVKVNTSRLW